MLGLMSPQVVLGTKTSKGHRVVVTPQGSLNSHIPYKAVFYPSRPCERYRDQRGIVPAGPRLSGRLAGLPGQHSE